jgi:hypothetical protein
MKPRMDTNKHELLLKEDLFQILVKTRMGAKRFMKVISVHSCSFVVQKEFISRAANATRCQILYPSGGEQGTSMK